MTEKKNMDIEEYSYSEEEDFETLDHIEDIDEDDEDDFNDKPCVTTCCCCCNLGLGSIMAGVFFMILNGIYIGRQMNNLSDAMEDGDPAANIAFNDMHLDSIFAFVGIALAGIGALTAFILMTLSCCCGVAEHVSKIKIGAFAWTVATGLSSIWVLGEAIYRSFPQEEYQTVTKGLGYIIVNDINNVENPKDDETKEFIINWVIAGIYILLYLYLAVVVVSFVHVLSRTRMSQSEQIAKRQGINHKQSGSPDLSVTNSDAGLIQQRGGYPGYQNQGYSPDNIATITEQVMSAQNFPELMQQQQMQQQGYPEQHMMPPQMSMLPPMFQETVVAGPNGEPITVVVDPNGQIVPPEIVQQIVQQHMMQMNGHMMQQQSMMMGAPPAQSECNSVITDVTYRSGAPLISNQVGHQMINHMQHPMERTKSVRSVRFEEKPQTRYIEPLDNSSSDDDDRKGVRFSLYTEEVEVSPYPAEQAA
jgi:hypothetical protein